MHEAASDTIWFNEEFQHLTIVVVGTSKKYEVFYTNFNSKISDPIGCQCSQGWATIRWDKKNRVESYTKYIKSDAQSSQLTPPHGGGYNKRAVMFAARS